MDYNRELSLDLGEDFDYSEISSPSPAERRINQPTNRQFNHYQHQYDVAQYLETDSPFAYKVDEIESFSPREEYSHDRYQPQQQYQQQYPQPPQYEGHYEEPNQPRYQQQQYPQQHYQQQGPSRFQPQAQTTRYQHSQMTYDEPPAAPVRGSNPRNSKGIQLIPVNQLPDIYRGVFKFGVFNAVQTTCYSPIMDTDENMVVSAPTGAGKTVLFELAIIRMLQEGNSGIPGTQSKCVYMAPTKALCSERFRDWTAKFDALGIKCCELTGDTVTFGKSSWGDAKNASVIITTGEKWDSLTRNWQEHERILSQVQLFLVDEVHILNETRGGTLEVVISRMKTRGTSVRFVMVSATVPNIDDVANWVGGGSPGTSAQVLEFGEEFRPCKLERIVYAVPRAKGSNDFQFVKALDSRLYDVVKAHNKGKPMLIFVSTRKGVFTTAQLLATEYTEASTGRKAIPWVRPTRIDCVFEDKKLADLAACGVGVHHAGLSMNDRRSMEQLFLSKALKVVVATSTLAVGVNLPAYTVIIKGVHLWVEGGMREYSPLDILQMAGRAGRQQFDKEGVAIIMCESSLESKYKNLTAGKTLLESSLHNQISEHLNSEVGLGTITSVDSAKEWLRNSFLFQRIRKNPGHYGAKKDVDQTWEEKIDELVAYTVQGLKDNELVRVPERDGDDDEGRGLGGDVDDLESTDYGDIMSKFYIRQATMCLILKLPEKVVLRDLLEMIATSAEVSEARLRASEKTIYNKMRTHNDMRYQIKKIEKTADKVFTILQAVLAGISLNSPEYKSADSQPGLDAIGVFKHVARIAKGIVEVAIVKKNGSHIKYGLELLRCLHAKSWDDRPSSLRQIGQIGEKSIKVLAEHNIGTLEALRNTAPNVIETLLNRKSPFGHEILSTLAEFPRYAIEIEEGDIVTYSGKKPVEVQLTITVKLVDKLERRREKKGFKSRGYSCSIITVNSDMEFIDYRRAPASKFAEGASWDVTAILTKPSQTVTVTVASEEVAGLTVEAVYKPTLSAKEYPVLDTRPLNLTDSLVASLQEDPSFWEDFDAAGADDEDDIEPLRIKDLTKVEKKPAVPPSAAPKTVAERKKLPDGRYECAHACKDRSKCAHTCCREGLVGKPKKLRATVTATQQQPAAGSSRLTPPPTVPKKKLTTRVDAEIAQLEALHEKSKSQPSSVRHPAKPPSRRLSGEVEIVSAPYSSLNVPGLYDDDDEDELVDFGALVNKRKTRGDVKSTSNIKTKTKAKVPSSDSYTNEAMDDLIRGVPIEIDIDPSPPPLRHSSKPNTSGSDRPRAGKEKAASPAPTFKRSRITKSDMPANKRARLEKGKQDALRSATRGSSSAAEKEKNTDSGDDYEYERSTYIHRSHHEPLFLPTSTSPSHHSDPDRAPEQDPYSFQIDGDPMDFASFDIIPASSHVANTSSSTLVGGSYIKPPSLEQKTNSPDSLVAYSKPVSGSNSGKGKEREVDYKGNGYGYGGTASVFAERVSPPPVQAETNPFGQKQTGDDMPDIAAVEEEEEEDELAALERWLQSGAVEITG